VEIAPTARGASSHHLARPIDHVSLSAETQLAMLGRIAWLLGVELRADAAVVRALGKTGESTIDVRGGDGFGLLLVDWVAGVQDTGDVVVLRASGAGAGDAAESLTTIEPVAGEIPEGVRVRGRVVTVGGRPVEGACVAADGRPPVRTDEHGRFACRVGHVGEPVRAWFAGRGPSDPTPSAAESFDVEIGVPVGRIVVGSQGGEGGTLVWTESLAGGEPLGLQGNDKGDVRINGVEKGRYRLRISAPGHAATTCEVTVRAGHTTTVTAALPTSTLRERLRNEHLSLEVEGVRLTAVLWDLMQRAALPVSFERTLGDAGAKLVSIDGRHTLEDILTKLCEAAGTEWRVDEDEWLVRIGAR
jgi:hypothetical protein